MKKIMLQTNENEPPTVISSQLPPEAPPAGTYEYRPGYCNAYNKRWQPCSAGAIPGTLRCKFHPVTKYYSYAEPPAPGLDQDQPEPAAFPTPALAEVLDPPLRLDLAAQAEAYNALIDDDLEADEPLYAAAGQPPKTDKRESGPEPPMVERFVYDSDLDDYVKKRVPVSAAPARVIDDSYHDGFELGPAYHEGDNAAFDYRWLNNDAKQNLEDRKNGFVPMKTSLDNRFRVEGGVVVFGDLILARRPKEITAQRAQEMMRTHERVTGERGGEDFHRDGDRSGVSTFGSVTVADDRENRGAARPRQEERQPAPRGGKSYAFPNNPIGRDLVAERHGSVGG